MAILEPDTIERLKRSSPRNAYEEVKAAVYQVGGSSEDFLETFQMLVEAGVMTWEDIERFEEAR